VLRVIPTLLLSERGLVKTQRFRKPVYVGDPRNVVRIFNDKEVDELALFDVRASRTAAPIDLAMIREIVSEAFMPVCYGGGVRSVAQAAELLRIGVEKIAVNTAALDDIGLVRALSAEFGAQCVVGSIDVRRDVLGRPRVWSHSGARVPERDPVAWAQALVAAGAGEIVVQSVDHEGTLAGPDLALFRTFDHAIDKPLVVGGGLSSVADMEATIRACRPSGLSVGARFVFYGPHRAVLVTYLEREELARLASLAS
jgi:imidazole glycerol-phosphate synthase subunit HisF